MDRIRYACAAVLFSVIAMAANSFSQTAALPSGSGTSGDPYQIASLDNLYWVTQHSSSWSSVFVQTSDIDASSSASWSGNGYLPMGTYSGTAFTGTYHGRGHTISGLYIFRNAVIGYDRIGMFGYCSGAAIDSLGLINETITQSNSAVGYVGGLVGGCDNTTIRSCYSSGVLATSSTDEGLGGLAGFSSSSSVISNCYSTCSVTGSSYTGGLVATNTYNGALISQIENCYSTGKVTGSSPVGGLVGENDATIDSCFWNTDSSGSTGIGGGTVTGAAGKTTAGMKDPSTFTAAGWDTAAWYMGDGINNGYPYLQWQFPGGTHLVTAVAPSSSSGSYLIASLDNLYWITQNSSSWGSSFQQTADIDASQTSGWASGSGFTPIGRSGTYFSGSYNGNGHVISGLYISRGGTSAVGLFGFPNSSASITKIGIINENISGQTYVGGLAGDNYGTVSNCYTTGSVHGSSNVGGLVGGAVEASISNSYSRANVSGSSNVGGLAGYLLEAPVSNCYSTGSSSGSGLIANNVASTVNNSFWDIQTSGQSGSGGGTGDSTAVMKTESTFTNAGWDFTNTWAIDSSVNNGYPGLVWQSQYSAAAPTAATGASTGVTSTGATVNGTVNPYKGVTTVKFIYGTVSGNYPDTVTASQSPVNGWGAAAVSASITGLSSNRTYYYRVIASNSSGSARGSEQSFTTHSIPTMSTIPGSSLSFNGTNQYVSVPDNSSLQLTNNMTLEAWVYPTGTGNMAIIDKGNYNYLFEIRPNGQSGLGLYNVAWGWIYSGGTVPLNAWSHVALVFQTGTNGVKFYLNGALLSQVTASGALTTNTEEFAIGEQAPGSCDCNFFQGSMDEVRVWGVARTEQQIRESMHRTLTGTETGLIWYWQFNEGSGTTAADSIGGNNGTLMNGPTWAVSTAPFGGGSSSSVFGVSTDTTANLAGVSVAFTDPFDNPSDLTITEIFTNPDSLPTGSATVLTNRYWAIDAFGTPGTFSANLTFTVPTGFTNSGSASASLYTLYHRGSTDDTAWASDISGASGLTGTTISFIGITSLGQFAIGTDDALPVELASFTATTDRLNVELNWKTATELNSGEFDVERQLTNDLHPAASAWSKVGSVGGHGTSNAPHTYSFTDNIGSAGTYSYRLKQIDHNGAFTYSQEVQVQVGAAPRVFALAQNYPNPFNPTTNIQFTVPSNGKTRLTVYNTLGQEVAVLFDAVATAGDYHQATFDASHLASGIYFSRLEFGGKMQVKKMLLLK